MSGTIWQRGMLNINDVTAFPIEFVRPCVEEGYAVVQVMLNPGHPDTSLDQVPVSYLKACRAVGAKVWGFVWADDFQSPESLYAFCQMWRLKSLQESCALTGFVINAEDGWEAHDMAGEKWSDRFCFHYRGQALTSKLSLALNTYNGCGGIDLARWQRAGARLYCQTFHEGNTHEWPIDGYIGWAAAHGYTKKAQIKPNWSTYKPYPSRAAQIASAKAAGTVGFSAWYAEAGGEPQDVLIPLLNEAKAAGVCL
jgi:hypothetical protein